MYDLAFAFNECGFGDAPDYIDRQRLFNVSFDTVTGEVKLYVLDASERFLYKLSADGITLQYAGDDHRHGGDHATLERHLGTKLDEREIVIDAVEEDVYYVYLDDARAQQSLAFFEAVRRVYGISESRMLTAINSIASHDFASVEEAVADKAISLVKLPFSHTGAKIYSRPFLHGNGIDLNARTKAFLARLYACEPAGLSAHLTHLWIAKELDTERTLVVTQRHGLLHRE
jgi:hypothetical protein